MSQKTLNQDCTSSSLLNETSFLCIEGFILPDLMRIMIISKHGEEEAK